MRGAHVGVAVMVQYRSSSHSLEMNWGSLNKGVLRFYCLDYHS